MKKIIGIIATAAVIAGMVLLLIGNKKKIEAQTESLSRNDMTESVTTMTVTRGPVCRDFSANAPVQAVSELNFVSDISGRVTDIYVVKGSKVRKGTALLKIDSDLLEADYKAALAAYESMKKDEMRFTRSNEAGGVTDQQLDNIRTQVLAAESRLAASKWRYENAVVKSPMNGTINMSYVQNGSLIAPNAPLFEIVDDKELKLTCMLPESRIGMVKVGDKVTATNSSSGDLFEGTVTSIGVKTDRGMNYPVEIRLKENKNLRIGMYLSVRFSESDGKPGILVPRKAIAGSALSANVYLAIDGKAVRREVRLGDMYGNDIEILEGLDEGESIIVSGLMNIGDGSDIKIIEK